LRATDSQGVLNVKKRAEVVCGGLRVNRTFAKRRSVSERKRIYAGGNRARDRRGADVEDLKNGSSQLWIALPANSAASAFASRLNAPSWTHLVEFLAMHTIRPSLAAGHAPSGLSRALGWA
jgi:hypothetical protein